MRKIKYMFIGALMTVIAAPAMAQATADNVGQEVSKVLKSGADAKTLAKSVDALAKPFKKDAKALCNIGRAFLAEKDFVNATKYAELAKKANKNYGDAYVLLGDIASLQDDGGAASSWYEQACYFDPKNPEGYRKYAIVNSKNPSVAIAKLEDLRTQRPDYPVDLIAADLQSRAGNLDAAINYYDKVDKSKMKDYELTDYALNLLLKQNFDKSLSISKYGNDKFPRYGALNRITMYNYVNTNRFEEALVYADRLFNKSDSVTVNVMDLQSYGLALSSTKQYDAAIKAYNGIFDLPDATPTAKNEVYKSLSDAYKAKGDYDLAASNYDKYLKGVEAPTAFIVANLASIYVAQARDENTPQDVKEAAIAKADKVYADMGEKFTQVADYAAQQRAQITYVLDPEGMQGKARPHYEQLAQIVEAKAEKGKTELARLKEAYQYLTIYYFKIANDIPKSKEYAELLQGVDPENETAAAVLSIKDKK